MHRSKSKPLMDRVSKGITSDAAAATFRTHTAMLQVTGDMQFTAYAVKPLHYLFMERNPFGLILHFTFGFQQSGI